MFEGIGFLKNLKHKFSQIYMLNFKNLFLNWYLFFFLSMSYSLYKKFLIFVIS
jgi:hypothetical protein